MSNESFKDFYSFGLCLEDGKNTILVAISTNGRKVFCVSEVNPNEEHLISIDNL